MSNSNYCKPERFSYQDNPDHTEAIDERYGAAAKVQEACLCTPVEFDSTLLEVIPNDVIERDYGCGDPTRWVKPGDLVLDLGSGSGKNAFICAQVVGENGFIWGVDRNQNMLDLAKEAAPIVSERIGYKNVDFLKGSIEALDEIQPDGKPLIAKSSVDVVLSNCVLNLISHSNRKALLNNIKRVLRPKGRIAISDIVCNKIVPEELQKDKDLWSGCISGAWHEDEFLNNFISIGFQKVYYAEKSKEPWKIIQGIEFRSATLVGSLN